MPDFEQMVVDGFDALTVIVMLEQCEPDLTVVSYWLVETMPYRSNHGAIKHWGLDSAPVQRTTCLACMLKKCQLNLRDEPRVSVLNAFKDKRLSVTHIGPRSDIWKCPLCASLPRAIGDFTAQLSHLLST